jgi:hypothetical protein
MDPERWPLPSGLCRATLAVSMALSVACADDSVSSSGEGSASSGTAPAAEADTTPGGQTGTSHDTTAGVFDSGDGETDPADATSSTSGTADGTTAPVADTSTSTTDGSGGSESTDEGFTTGEPEGCDGLAPDDPQTCVLEVYASGQRTCARLGDGVIKCWGSNGLGELGLGDTSFRGDDPGEMGDQLPAVDLGFAVGRLAITHVNACASSLAGDVKCWGAGGALGLGILDHRGDEPGEMGAALPFVDLGGPGEIVGPHCARMPGGLKCWGVNTYGQLGLGDTEPRGDEPGEMGAALPFIDLEDMVGVETTLSDLRCASDTLGRVKCWGYNETGVLGLGDGENRGDEPGEMGGALPFVDLGRGAVVERISSAGANTCALLAGGSVKCWGLNNDFILDWPGAEPTGDQIEDMGDNLPAIDFGVGAVALDVRVGWDFACVLLEGGDVKCWGENSHGVLGMGPFTFLGGVADLPPIDLGAGEVAVQITTGLGHACALLESGHVKCWGRNGYGELGLGHTESIGDDDGEMGDALPYVELF